MRKILLIMLAMVFLSIPCFASDWSVNAKGGLYFPSDEELQSGKYIQAELQWKNIYAFGQYITDMERRIAGQRAGMVDIFGVGLGAKFPITQYIKLYGQIGYYIPKSEMAGGRTAPDWSDSRHFRESQWLYWKNWGSENNYNVKPYQVFEYKIQSGAPGAAIGLDAEYPLSKHLGVGMNFGYQYLRFQETFYARNPAMPDVSYIQTRQEKDFGGFNFGLNLAWRF